MKKKEINFGRTHLTEFNLLRANFLNKQRRGEGVKRYIKEINKDFVYFNVELNFKTSTIIFKGKVGGKDARVEIPILQDENYTSVGQAMLYW